MDLMEGIVQLVWSDRVKYVSDSREPGQDRRYLKVSSNARPPEFDDFLYFDHQSASCGVIKGFEESICTLSSCLGSSF
jgi:hypothetical protein